MSTSVWLRVDRARVSTTAWRRLFDETLLVLRGWPDPPLRRSIRTLHGSQVAVYVRDVEDVRGWRICGDTVSRRFGESVDLPRDFGVDDPSPSEIDIVAPAILERGRAIDSLLGMNTHGRAYHALVTAVAMLVEHRLPQAALAGGDIDAREARHARARLQSILREDVPLPLVVRPEELRERLSAFVDGQALDDAIELVCGPSPQWRAIAADLLGIWQRRSDRVPHDEVDSAVTCTDAALLGEPARHVFEIFVEQAARTVSRAEIPTKLAGADRNALLSSLARRASEAGLALTEMAWDDIANAEVSQLRMLAAISMLESRALLWCQARRAIFESAGMRKFAAGVWTSILGAAGR